MFSFVWCFLNGCMHVFLACAYVYGVVVYIDCVTEMVFACCCCSEMLSAPVRRIDEILSLPHSADDFKGQELPPSDDDAWLYYGETELNAALEDRQKEMELFDSRRKRKQKLKEEEDVGPSEYDLGEIAASMQAFVKKMSSYEGAEVPEDR